MEHRFQLIQGPSPLLPVVHFGGVDWRREGPDARAGCVACSPGQLLCAGTWGMDAPLTLPLGEIQLFREAEEGLQHLSLLCPPQLG